jgi:hypothetical protein
VVLERGKEQFPRLKKLERSKKMKKIVYLILGLVLTLVVFYGASSVMAAGEDPASAVLLGATTSETCMSDTILQPGASMWVKIPYVAGNDVEIYAKGTASLDFGVYFGDQSGVPGYPSLGNPVGKLMANSNEPKFLGSWRGHIGTGNASGFIYVLVKNTKTHPVTFSLCTITNGQYFPPPWEVTLPVHCVFDQVENANGFMERWLCD